MNPVLKPFISLVSLFYSICASDSLKSQNFRNALRLYSVLVALNPSNTDYYTNRGFCFLALDRIDLALEDFSKAIELAPHKFVPRFNRSAAYIRNGQSDRALDDVNVAITLTKKDKEIWLARNNRIIALLKLGHIEEAEKELTLMGDSGNPGQQCTSALVKAAVGNLDEAAELARKSVSLIVKDPRTCDEAAKVLEKAGHLTEAESVRAKAKALRENFKTDNFQKRFFAGIYSAVFFGFIFSFCGVGQFNLNFFTQYTIYVLLIVFGLAIFRSYGLIMLFILIGSLVAEWYAMPALGLYDLKLVEAETISEKQKNIQLEKYFKAKEKGETSSFASKLIYIGYIFRVENSNFTLNEMKGFYEKYSDKGLLLISMVDPDEKKSESEKLESRVDWPVVSNWKDVEEIKSATDFTLMDTSVLISGADSHVIFKDFTGTNTEMVIKKAIDISNSQGGITAFKDKKLIVLPVGLYIFMVLFGLTGGGIDLLLQKKYGQAQID